jgi:hemolysin III
MHRFREPFSGLTHLAAAVTSAGGLVWLIVATWNDIPRMISMIIYGASLIVLYAASTALHLIKAPERIIGWLNRIDHSAIYVLIAGTYTPFCYLLLDGWWRWGMLIAIWTIALGGIIYKLSYYGRWKYDYHVSTVVYVLMGWLAIIALPQFLAQMPLSALALVAGGGVVYTAGAVVYALDKPDARPRFSYHDAWHIFVMVASTMHFLAIVIYLT